LSSLQGHIPLVALVLWRTQPKKYPANLDNHILFLVSSMSCVFLTGATGVIGSELVAQLLQQPDREIYALMRAASPSHLETRRRELLGFCAADVTAGQRLHAVAGDISKTHLGLDEDLIRNLTDRVTRIIHCAGNVRLNQDLDAARRNAVEPARLILDLARRCPRLEKIDVVSTIGVCGTMRGLIPERQLTEPRAFRNNYEASKAEAEELYYDSMEEGIPLTVHRPSMVVGHSRTGRVRQFQVFYHLCEFLSGRRSFGLVVDPGQTTLDLVPVDWVAETILRSNASSKPLAKHCTFARALRKRSRFESLHNVCGTDLVTKASTCRDCGSCRHVGFNWRCGPAGQGGEKCAGVAKR
jgi:thioester reductase-like protein